jgi:hypothetical protein
MRPSWKWLIWSVLGAALLTVLAVKAAQLGWLAAHPPLDLHGRLAVLFFNSERGCECALVVYRNAEAQVAAWPEAARVGITVHRIDLDRRPDLAQQYGVVRAPTLVLLDEAGAVVWRQDESLSDEVPLDLGRLDAQIQALVAHELK